MPTRAELAVLLKLHDEFSSQMVKPTKAVEGFGGTMQRVNGITRGFLQARVVEEGVRSFIGGLKGASEASRESARVQQQTNAVLTSTGGAAGVSAEEVRELAQRYQELTRFTDEEVQSAENMLLTFTRIGRNIFPEVTETVLDMSTALGQDTKTSAIQLGKALQDPINGVTALRRVGVAFTADQQQQIKTLVESGRGMEAQRLILAELKREFGGSATAMTPFEKRIDGIKDTIDEANESLGFIVQGGLTEFADWFDEHEDDIRDFVSQFEPYLEALDESVGTHFGGMVEFIKGIGQALSEAVGVVDDIAHGRWQSAWDGVKNIVLNTGEDILNGLIHSFGSLPNILISGVEAGINGVISVLNSVPEIRTPDLGPLGGPRTIFGGFNIGKVDLGRIEPPQFARASQSLDFLQSLGEKAKDATPPVAKLRNEVEDFGEAATDTGEKLSAFLKQLGSAVQGFIKQSGIDSAVGALFGATSREQANLQLQKANAELFKAQNGPNAVHFGAGSPSERLFKVGSRQTVDQQIELIDLKNNAARAKIIAEKLLITEDQRAEAADELLSVTRAQTKLIRERLNPSVYDLIPEVRAAQTEFVTFTGLLQTGGQALNQALLGLAQRLNDYELPSLTGKNGQSMPGQEFLNKGGLLGPGTIN